MQQMAAPSDAWPHTQQPTPSAASAAQAAVHAVDQQRQAAEYGQQGGRTQRAGKPPAARPPTDGLTMRGPTREGGWVQAVKQAVVPAGDWLWGLLPSINSAAKHAMPPPLLPLPAAARIKEVLDLCGISSDAMGARGRLAVTLAAKVGTAGAVATAGCSEGRG